MDDAPRIPWFHDGVDRQRLGEEALQLGRSIEDAYSVSSALFHLGLMACERRDYEQAAAALMESLTLEQTLGSPDGIGRGLANVAVLATACDQLEAAARLFSAVTATLASERRSFGLPETATYDRMLDGLRTRMGDQAFSAAWNAGQAMTLDQAVEEARAVAAAAGRAGSRNRGGPVSTFGLTPREQEVLRLIVEGHSDREIAEALFISRRTVTSHVTNIFTKLGVNSRSAATAYAIRRGLA